MWTVERNRDGGAGYDLARYRRQGRGGIALTNLLMDEITELHALLAELIAHPERAEHRRLTISDGIIT